MRFSQIPLLKSHGVYVYQSFYPYFLLVCFFLLFVLLLFLFYWLNLNYRIKNVFLLLDFDVRYFSVYGFREFLCIYFYDEPTFFF